MDYVLQLYQPAQSQRRKLQENGAALACDLARWKRRVTECWPGVTMELLVQPPGSLYVDENILLRVRARLNGLTASDVRLECLLGNRHGDELEVAQTAELEATTEEDEATEFTLDLTPAIAGLQYYQLRLYPCNEALSHPFETGCMIWI
jgi:starch phosphorylase